MNRPAANSPPSDRNDRPPIAVRGVSEYARSLREQIPRLARTLCPVAIAGETGTGKEHLAHAIHRASARWQRPFQVVDCATIPAGLLGRELFGHERGAFTGAEEASPGRLQAAEGGTVLFRGLQELDLSSQATLLRVLQEGEIVPLGASAAQQLDLRFLQTSQHSLDDLVREGRLRSDLYYRLNTIQITIPPLRQRPDDLAFFLEHFLQRQARQQRRAALHLSPELRSRLLRYSWPGNLRQLENVVDCLVALSSDCQLGVGDLPEYVIAATDGPGRRQSAPSETYSIPDLGSFRRQVETFQRVLIERAWRRAGKDRGRLLEALELAPHQLKYLVSKLSLRLDR